MLIDLIILFVSDDSSFILPDGLWEVTLLLVQQTYLDQSVTLSLERKSVGQDGVLEVTDGLLELVGLREDHAELVEHFTLLVEVGGHLQDCDESADCMVVRFKFFVEDANAIP